MNHDSHYPSALPLECKQLHHEYAGTLASQLMHSQRIPNDQSLVQLLGHGFESNNREVMESWVYAVCSQLRLPFSYQSLPVLESTLEAVLGALNLPVWHDNCQEVQHGS